MSYSPQAAITALESKFKVLKKTEFRGETSLAFAPEEIFAVCKFCRDELGFSYLLDLSGMDHMGEDPRFEVVYELYQMEKGEWLRIRTRVSEDNPEVDSVSGIWATADWHEREAYDMFGIRFRNHPDLRRILMWDGYPYYPLRKEFPLSGKDSLVPEVAFTAPAPLEGGPFVTVPTTATTKDREPRSRSKV